MGRFVWFGRVRSGSSGWFRSVRLFRLVRLVRLVGLAALAGLLLAGATSAQDLLADKRAYLTLLERYAAGPGERQKREEEQNEGRAEPHLDSLPRCLGAPFFGAAVNSATIG